MSVYCKECGLNDVHFHTLRHSFATRFVEIGCDIKSLSEILSHSNTKITLDRYVHSSLELKRANMMKHAEIGYDSPSKTPSQIRKASYIKEFCGFFTDEITLRKEFGKQALFL